RLSEMEQMLLGLVRGMPHARAANVRAIHREACELGADDALQCVQASAGDLPFVRRVPRKTISQSLRCSPAVGISEPGQDGSGGGHPERLNQLASQDAQRDGIKNEDALARKGDHAAVRGKVEKLADVEVGSPHGASNQFESRAY